MTPRRWVQRALAIAVIGLAGACNAILGITHDAVLVTGADAGARCVLSSDCADVTKVCLFQVCSKPCTEDRDCDQGARCLRTGRDGVACVDVSIAVCSTDADCPSGTTCADDGVCRQPCGSNKPCLPDQQCSAASVCVGTSPDHDPTHGAEAGPPSGAGGASGSGGTAASSGGMPQAGGGSTGMVDASMPIPDAAMDAGPMDAGPMDAGPMDAGPMCTPEGAIRCDGMASPVRSQCKDGEWVIATPCDTGKLCDTASATPGTCAAVVAACVGRSPGESFCSGADRIVCGPDLVTSKVTHCSDAAHCAQGAGDACAPCVTGEHQCMNGDLYRCNDTSTAFVLDQQCMPSAPCNAQAGACTTLACLPNQKRCNGDALEQCNSTQSGFQLVKNCGPGLCDPTNLVCDVCPPDSTNCKDTGTTQTCAHDGQSYSTSPCASGTPHCVGSGACVECTAANQCSPPDDCHTATCNTGSGSCVVSAKTPGQACAGGYCNASAKCVQCLDATQCTASGECNTAACSAGGACGNTPKGAGIKCSAGYCNGSGACVQCTSASQCSVPECYTPTCSTNTCGKTALGSGTVCSTGYCNGSGGCVQCTLASQCNVPECYAPTCTGNTCGKTPRAQNTACSTGVCNGNGACVACNTPSQCPSVPVCYQPTCNSNMCGQTPLGPGTMCTGGVCDGSGRCVQCVSSAQCGSQEVCRANQCVNALHTWGWQGATASSSTVTKNTLYLMRLPVLAHGAIVLGFGINGTASAAADMVLYADNGQGTAPTGTRLTQASSQIPLINGERETNANPPSVTLAAGKSYWLGFAVGSDTSIKAAADSGGVGLRDLMYTFGSTFPANPTGSNNGGLDYAIWIDLQDTD